MPVYAQTATPMTTAPAYQIKTARRHKNVYAKDPSNVHRALSSSICLRHSISGASVLSRHSYGADTRRWTCVRLPGQELASEAQQRENLKQRLRICIDDEEIGTARQDMYAIPCQEEVVAVRYRFKRSQKGKNRN